MTEILKTCIGANKQLNGDFIKTTDKTKDQILSKHLTISPYNI
jgi:hypothetical protein